MAYDISVSIAKCSECQVRSAASRTGPCTGTGISSFHQGKGSNHPTSSCFLPQAPEKGCGHVQHLNVFLFQTYGVGTTLTTERTHVFWYPKESGSLVFIRFPYQDTSVTTRETCSHEDALISISWFEKGQNCNYHTWE